MARARGTLVAVGIASLALAACVAGVTPYTLNGVVYSVPRQYEFTRAFSLPWLEGAGLPQEPEESVWLLFPASDLARDVPGYRQRFHGYSDEVQADLTVNVLGGDAAGEFQAGRDHGLGRVAEEIAQGTVRQVDNTAGWDRVYWSRGVEGTPGEGHDLFYLIPNVGTENLPADWRIPSCRSSPDLEGRETYGCAFVILRRGLTYHFTLTQENVGIANTIPDYVESRLQGWSQ